MRDHQNEIILLIGMYIGKVVALLRDLSAISVKHLTWKLVMIMELVQACRESGIAVFICHLQKKV